MSKMRYKPQTFAAERKRLCDLRGHGMTKGSIKRAKERPEDFTVPVTLDFLQRVCADASALESMIAHDAMGDIMNLDKARQFSIKTAKEIEHRLRLYAYGYTEGKDDEIKDDTQFKRQLMDLIAKLMELLPEK